MKNSKIAALLLGASLSLLALTSPAATGRHTQMQVLDSTGQAFTAYRWTWFNTQGWETDTGHTIVFDNFLNAWAYATLEPNGQLHSSGLIVGQIPPDKLDFPLHLRPFEEAAMDDSIPGSGPISTNPDFDVAPSCLGGIGSISGTVHDASGTPIAGADVWATRWAGWGYADSYWDWAPDGWTTQTDAVGNYQLPVYPGFYEVWASGVGWTSEFHANEITVTSNASAGPVDITLFAEGKVSGQVTNNNGQALTNAGVTVYRWNALTEWWDTHSWLNTDDGGKYFVNNLSAGKYAFCFSAPNYINACYQNAPDLESANSVSVTPGSNIAGINTSLALGGSLSGTVDGPDGNPVNQYTSVALFDADGCCFENYDYITSTSVDYYNGTGGYSFNGLAPGDYLVRFDGQGNYASEWYDNASSHESATKVHVVGGQETTNIDAQLAAPGPSSNTGSISGTITDEQDNLIEDAYPNATAYKVVEYENDTSWSWAGSGQMSRDDGTYVISDLPAGTYHVCFSAGERYQDQCYNNKSNDIFSATDILVSEGASTSNIDAKLHRWNAAISGQLTDRTTNIPIEQVIFGISTEQDQWQHAGWTDVCGNYQAYYDSGVNFAAWLYQSHNSHLWPNMYYGDTLLFEQATMINIPADQTTQTLDIDLPRAGAISGTITDVNGRPVKNADVFIWYDCGTNHICGVWPTVYTDSNGAYKKEGVLPGVYHVSTPGVDGDLWRYDVTVSEGQTTSDIDLSPLLTS